VSFVVAIDGPAAAGKSTVAREVARALGMLYVDTGAMYRALAVKLRDAGIRPDDESALDRCLSATRLEIAGTVAEPVIRLDGALVGDAIRAPEVGEMASRLAAMPRVRRMLVEVQRALAARGPLVAEGRDLGTVVFPDAEVKIFLEAELETRARRRARELQARGLPVPAAQVLEELRQRDERDRSRADSPLRPAPDSIRIDSRDKTIGEVVERILEAIRSHPRWSGPAGAGAAPGGAAQGPAR
jgi:cytidylate kinase